MHRREAEGTGGGGEDGIDSTGVYYFSFPQCALIEPRASSHKDRRKANTPRLEPRPQRRSRLLSTILDALLQGCCLPITCGRSRGPFRISRFALAPLALAPPSPLHSAKCPCRVVRRRRGSEVIECSLWTLSASTYEPQGSLTHAYKPIRMRSRSLSSSASRFHLQTRCHARFGAARPGFGCASFSLGYCQRCRGRVPSQPRSSGRDVDPSCSRSRQRHAFDPTFGPSRIVRACPSHVQLRVREMVHASEASMLIYHSFRFSPNADKSACVCRPDKFLTPDGENCVSRCVTG